MFESLDCISDDAVVHALQELRVEGAVGIHADFTVRFFDTALLADNGYGFTKSLKETENCKTRRSKSKAKMQNSSNVSCRCARSQPQET